MVNVLGLKAFRPITESRVEQKADGSAYSVMEVEPVFLPTSCPQCGNTALHKHGTRCSFLIS